MPAAPAPTIANTSPQLKSPLTFSLRLPAAPVVADGVAPVTVPLIPVAVTGEGVPDAAEDGLADLLAPDRLAVLLAGEAADELEESLLSGLVTPPAILAGVVLSLVLEAFSA